MGGSYYLQTLGLDIVYQIQRRTRERVWPMKSTPPKKFQIINFTMISSMEKRTMNFVSQLILGKKISFHYPKTKIQKSMWLKK